MGTQGSRFGFCGGYLVLVVSERGSSLPGIESNGPGKCKNVVNVVSAAEVEIRVWKSHDDPVLADRNAGVDRHLRS